MKPSQLEELCTELGVTIHAKKNQRTRPEWPDTQGWDITLRFDGRMMKTTFWTGPAIKDDPTAADVLWSLCSDARMGEETFEEFCSNLGYDTDSRRVYATWQACKRTAPKLRRFLGEDFPDFCNAEH
jgi:hypothetical protein